MRISIKFAQAMTLLVGIVCLFVALSVPVGAQEDDICPGSLPPRLVVGEQGEVGPGSANNVRDMPSVSGDLLYRMEAGSVFIVLDGPVCSDDFTWWQVEYDGETGWTVEGDDTDYFLLPIDASEATPTAGVTPAPADDECTLESRLIAGREGRLTSNTPSRLRDEASTSGTQVGQIQPLDTFDILEGPVCADGIHWWRVQVGTTSGWTAEGINGDYFLEMLEIVPTATPAFIGLPRAMSVTWSSDGERIAVGTVQGIFLYDATDFDAMPQQLFEGFSVNAVAFHPSEPEILGARMMNRETDDVSIVLIDVTIGDITSTLSGSRAPNRDLTFSADGDFLAVMGGAISVYELEGGVLDYDVTPMNYTNGTIDFAGFQHAAMSADASWVGGTYPIGSGSLVFFGEYGADSTELISIETVSIEETTTAIAISPDGTMGIVGDDRGNLRGWSLPDFEYHSFIRGERSTTSNAIVGMVFHPTEPVIVTSERDPLAVVRVFNAATLEQIRAQVLEGTSANDLTFSSDGEYLAVIVDAATVHILETVNYTLVAQLVMERF